METEQGRIIGRGAGGFLNPPTHPEHNYSVETDLQQRPEDRGSMSLSYAVSCEWLDSDTRRAAAKMLKDWQKNKPGLNDPAVQEWIGQVLGYFRNCYAAPGRDMDDPETWHADKLAIANGERAYSVERHAGVHFIREFYPEYKPSTADFDRAKWGK
jgi:hypothetical protein